MKTFQNTSGKMIVADPCYENGEGPVLSVTPGDWEASIEISDEGKWGRRCAQLIAVLKGVSVKESEWTWRATKGVDSGQMAIGDATVFGGGEYGIKGTWYGDCCEATGKNAQWGIVHGAAAVSSSGFGDGCYNMDVVQREGKIVAIRVTFIDGLE